MRRWRVIARAADGEVRESVIEAPHRQRATRVFLRRSSTVEWLLEGISIAVNVSLVRD